MKARQIQSMFTALEAAQRSTVFGLDVEYVDEQNYSVNHATLTRYAFDVRTNRDGQAEITVSNNGIPWHRDTITSASLDFYDTGAARLTLSSNKGDLLIS